MNTTEIEINYTERVTLRLRSEDRIAFEEKAREHSKDLSEWMRETLLASLAFEGDHRLLLAELMAVRGALFQVLASMAEGKKLSSDSITKVLAQADERKFVMADTRIASYVAEN